MKRLLLTMTFMACMIFSGILVHALANNQDMAVSAVTCPDCSGPEITNVLFTSGMDCVCTNADYLKIGPNVTVESGASVTFKAPRFSISSGVHFEAGANVRFVKIGVASIALSADPLSITTGDSHFSTITALLKDGEGNAVPQGTAVAFSTTLGTFPNEGTTWSDETYDDTGAVVVYLYAGTITGKATVTANSGGISSGVAIDIGGSSDPDSIKLTAQPSEVPADGVSMSTLTAEVKDEAGEFVTSEKTVQFTITEGTGSLSSGSAKTVNGKASVTLISATEGTVKIEANIVDYPDIEKSSVTVTFTLGSLSLSASKNYVLTDNSDSIVITAGVLNNNHVPWEGAEVAFTTTGGSISATTVYTKSDGKAEVTFSSGTGTLQKENRIVQIMANVTGLTSQSIPIEIAGTDVTLTTPEGAAVLVSIDEDDWKPFVIKVTDAGPNGIYKAPVSCTQVGGSGTVNFHLKAPDSELWETDLGGELIVLVEGVSQGDAEIQVTSLGADAKQTFQVSEETIQIIFPPKPTDENPDPVGIFLSPKITTGPISNVKFSSPDKITRESGSFLEDGFSEYIMPSGTVKMNMKVQVMGTDGNDNIYTLSGVVTQSSLTVTPNVIFEDMGGERDVTIRQVLSEPDGNTELITPEDETIKILFFPASGQNSQYIKREGNGSFVLDGFKPGKYVQVSGSSENDGLYTIESVTSDKLVFAPTPKLVEEGNNPGISLTQLIITPAPRTVAMVTGEDISFGNDQMGPYIERAAETFINDGFIAGDRIMVGGSRLNDTYNDESLTQTDYYQILNVTATRLYLVKTTKITEETAGQKVSITNGLLLKLKAKDEILLATTFGAWDGTGKMSVVKSPDNVNEQIMPVFSAEKAGRATIEAYRVADNNDSDSRQINIALPPEDAAWVEVQAEPSTVPKHTTGITPTTATLEVTVRSVDDQVVGGAPVIFTIENPTGGGENISPVIVYTNSLGKALATFTPGELSTDSNGVTVKAGVLDMPTVEPGFFSIIIGGTAGSVIVGHANTVSSVQNDTAYDLALSVQVVDANGNAVSGTTVSLALWPKSYAQGYWEGDYTYAYCDAIRTTVFNNEDANRNLILDSGEDLNGDGELTPSSSAAGGVSSAGAGTAKTDANGVARFTLTYLKTSAGWIQATLTASALVYGTEAKGSTSFWLPHDIEESCSLPDSSYNEEKPVANISLTAVPNALLADGQSTSAIRAAATDIDGNAVENGTKIDFGITGGTSSGGLPYASSETAFTTNGVATVSYRAGETVGTVEITAQSDNGISDSIEIDLTAGGIMLTADPVKLLANGESRSTIYANVKDAQGQPAPEYTRVNFVITRGAGGLPYSTTDYGFTSNGVATATYRAGETSGTVEIMASTSMGASQIVQLTLSDGGVNLSAESYTLVANGSSSTTITAYATDINEQKVPDNTRIDFVIIQGSGKLGYSTTASDWTTGGYASTTYRSGETPGKVIISASTSTGASDEVALTLTPVNITVSASQSSLPANGESESQITATVTDSTGAPVTGENIRFAIAEGSGGLPWGPSTVIPTEGGIATAVFRASTVPGTVKIVVTGSGGAYATLEIALTGGNLTGTLSLNANPATLETEGDKSTISAILKDENEKPLAGKNVIFETTLGSFSNLTQTKTVHVQTNENGVAEADLYPGELAGVAAVYARYEEKDISDGSSVFINGSRVCSAITLSADHASITADGKSTSAITAVLTDVNGDPVPQGTEVTFKTTLGAISQQMPLKTPDDSGSLTVQLTSADGMGTATVYAYSGNASGATSVIFTDQGLKSLALDADPSGGTVNSETVLISNITATLKDENGNPPQEGTARAKFSTTLGWFQYPGALGITVDPSRVTVTDKTTSEIKAVLVDEGGNPISGENVFFMTTLGLFTDARTKVVKTDQNGEARVTLAYDETLGVAAVYAQWNTVSTAATVAFMVNNVPGYVEIESLPNRVSADNGKSFSEILVTVRDQDNKVANKKDITFHTTLGNFPNGLRKQEATTDENGNAMLTLYSPPEEYAGVATVYIEWEDENVSGVCNVLFGRQELALDSSGESGTVTVNLISGTIPGVASVIGEYEGANVSSSATVTLAGKNAPGPMALTAVPSSIPADGGSQSAITALLKKSDGSPADQGTLVTFYTTSGQFANGATSYATTTAGISGKATAYLVSDDTAGAATVYAVSGTVGQQSRPVSVLFADTGTGAIAVEGKPSIIEIDGQATVTAVCKDFNGVPLPKGTSIFFNTTLGILSAQQATTIDESGTASVSLISGGKAGLASVIAQVDTVSSATTVGFRSTDPESITLTALPKSLVADGVGTCLIDAVIKDLYGLPVAKGTGVIFKTTLGTFPNGALEYEVDTTDDTGIITVALKAGITQGIATVVCSSDNISQTVSIPFLISQWLGSIVLVADLPSIEADNESTSVITATVKDYKNEPAAVGTVVTFTSNIGTFTNGQSSISKLIANSLGTVTASLKSNVPGTAKILGSVTLREDTISNMAVVRFTQPANVASVTLTSANAGIPADGKSSSAISALVKTSDNQLLSGAEVAFKTSRGAITSPHTTDAGGKAVATLTSDRYNDSNVLVTAVCEGVEGTALLSFAGLDLTLRLEGSATVLTGAQSTISALLKDAAGNPIPGATLTFNADKTGIMDPAESVTDALGEAKSTVTSGTAGEITVTVTGLGAEASVKILFTRYEFLLSADPNSIRVGGGTEFSRVTATLLDRNTVPPSPVEGATVSFSSTLGTLNPYLVQTDANGNAETILRSLAQSGTAVVNANVTVDGNDLSASTKVTVVGGVAGKIVLNASPSVIGLSEVSTITATVYDQDDQPSVNQNIYFQITKGPSGGESLNTSVVKTNASGVATVELTAGSLPSVRGGVEIEANTSSDFSASNKGVASLTIAGPPVYIGISMNVETLKEVDTGGGRLEVGVTAIATDVYGNPVADGTNVYMGVESLKFDEDRANTYVITCWDDEGNPLNPCPDKGTPGFGHTWFSNDVNQDGYLYSQGCALCVMCTTEDVNHNGILDVGEDKNDNGVIDPIQGCVIDGSVQTVGGVANATLIYPMSFAANITARLTATAGAAYGYYNALLLCTNKMAEQGTCGIGY